MECLLFEPLHDSELHNRLIFTSIGTTIGQGIIRVVMVVTFLEDFESKAQILTLIA